MRLNKMQDRASRHISRAKHNHGRRHLRRYYYPATETEEEYSDGYEFSAGLSDTDWQFGFTVRNSQ
jgi:hypothetical protein